MKKFKFLPSTRRRCYCPLAQPQPRHQRSCRRRCKAWPCLKNNMYCVNHLVISKYIRLLVICQGNLIATTQLNSTQSWVSLIFLCKPHHNRTTTTPQPQNRIPLYLSSYTTKLDQIQYATLFQPN